MFARFILLKNLFHLAPPVTIFRRNIVVILSLQLTRNMMNARMTKGCVVCMYIYATMAMIRKRKRNETLLSAYWIGKYVYIELHVLFASFFLRFYGKLTAKRKAIQIELQSKSDVISA